MSAFSTKLWIFCLSAVLAVPMAVCSSLAADDGPHPAPSSKCCSTSENRPSVPIQSLNSCCCQKRVNTSNTVELGDKKAGLPEPLPALPANLKLAEAGQRRSHAFFENGDRSFQTLFCVWLR